MNRLLELATQCLGYAAAVFLLAMMGLTVTDVLLRTLLSRPIQGAYELVELCLACAIFLGLPALFLKQQNVVVDVVDHAAPAAVPLLRRLAAAASVVLLATMAWNMLEPARDTLTFGDVTADLGLPRIVYWAPVLTGVAAATLAALIMLFKREAKR